MKLSTVTLLSLVSGFAYAQDTELESIIDEWIPTTSSSSVKHGSSIHFSNPLTTLVTSTTLGNFINEDITTTSANAQSSTSPVNSDVHQGVATFYSVGGDNCGTSSTDSDFVCAISQQLYETSVNGEDVSSYCGKSINITYNGVTITVTVVDSCPSCDANHLDLSPSAFQALADPNLGVIDISWVWA